MDLFEMALGETLANARNDAGKAEPAQPSQAREQLVADLVVMIGALLNWPNPDGRIKEAYIPQWLRDNAAAAIKKADCAQADLEEALRRAGYRPTQIDEICQP